MMGEDKILIQSSLLPCIYCNIAKYGKSQGTRLLL